MNEIDKKNRYNKLLYLYGSLLTENRQEKLESYFAMDLSMGEIALEDGISRNAVHLSIKEAIRELEYYESKLHLLEKYEKLGELVEGLSTEGDHKEIIEKIKEELNYGI